MKKNEYISVLMFTQTSLKWFVKKIVHKKLIVHLTILIYVHSNYIQNYDMNKLIVN